jgi:guanosine-3',5'-bis(diphosphate) 3'-pyrophosphohydrolase
MTEPELKLFLDALKFAAEKHRHQRRKDAAASPYINHPIAVAETLVDIGHITDITTIVAALLHDTIEDTETTEAELEARFGTDICSVVCEVSDDKTLTALERKRLQVEHAASASTRARLVKLADKICNVNDVIDNPPAGWSDSRRRDYIQWAGDVVEAVRGTNTQLETHFDGLRSRARELEAS